MPETQTQSVEADEQTGANPQRAAMTKAAKADPKADAEVLQEEISTSEAMDAMDFFLNPDPDEEVTEKTIKLRVGRPGSPREWTYWTIRAMERERIQQIREQHRKQTPGRRRRGGEPEADDMAANLRIATEGTASPDLADPKVRGKYADPADALRARFAFKPGLIDQIAAEIITFSGYDDDDVDEVQAVKT